MKKTNFLGKLVREQKLEMVEPSEEMKDSYLIKSENCLRSAKILLQNQLYENSTSESYYCMYNSLLALFFKVGVKSENHSGSIALFDKLFNNQDLLKIISKAKEERIDKQYYVDAQQITKATLESCEEIVSDAETFLIKIKLLVNRLDNEEIKAMRNKLSVLLKRS